MPTNRLLPSNVKTPNIYQSSINYRNEMRMENNSMPSFNNQLVLMVQFFEGLSLVGYQDKGDVPTIGYGHTGEGVIVGEEITLEEADNYLITDLTNASNQIRSELGSLQYRLNNDQFSALTSFVFNLGIGMISVTDAPTMYHVLMNALRTNMIQDWEAVASHMETFDHMSSLGDEVILGLRRRRRAEALMLLSRDWRTYNE